MSESLGEQIRHILREAPFAMRQLAADAGLSYDVLRSWRSGRRRPSRSSAVRLAAGLQQRGELLLRLAAELQAAAEPPGQARAREEGAPRADPSRPDTGRALESGSTRPGEAANGRSGEGATPDEDRSRQESGFGVSRPTDGGGAGSLWRHGATREGGSAGDDARSAEDEAGGRGPASGEPSDRQDFVTGGAGRGDTEPGTDSARRS